MPQDNKTKIIVALIGLASAVIVATLANWDKVFPPKDEIVLQSRPLAVPEERPPASPIITPNSQNISGTYTGISTEGITRSSVRFTLRHQGNTVAGTYWQEGMTGRISGTLEGNTMDYEWDLGGEYFGRGVSVIQGRNIGGTWGYGVSDNNGGTTSVQLQ